MTTFSSKGVYSPSTSLLPLTAFTLFASAFLLFSVQPFFTKMVLPYLGGAPSVWSVAMVFFQSILLAGYAYAHLLTSRFSLRTAVVIHVAVMLAALASLPIGLPEGWTTAPANGETAWLVGLFTLSVGLPFFAVSANGPLLQAWFAKSGHPDAADPYFLYRASNIGSFASLFAYILLIEPFFDLPTQSKLWTAGFGILCCCITATGYLTFRQAQHVRSAGLDETTKPGIAADATPVRWQEWLIWIGLAFIPSALLVAVTAHISTDVASVPFLWILPLAMFLLTFVVAFGRNADWWAPRTALILPLLIVALVFFTVTSSSMPIFLTVLLHVGTFFFGALHCHLLLAKRRPAANQLTKFYFAMSIGGVLGGIFSGLLAPRLFDWNAEYLILQLVVLLTVKEMTGQSVRDFATVSSGVVLRVLAMVLLAHYISGGSVYGSSDNYYVVAIAILALIGYAGRRSPETIPALCLCLVIHSILNAYVFRESYTERSFFGVVKIYDQPQKNARLFMHGTTIHGAMRLEDAQSGRPVPLTYYSDGGGLNISLVAARANKGGVLPYTGLVGVGAGSMACQMKEGERLDLIDIDPLVLKIAQDPRHFRFLSECAKDANVEIGDGRRVIESRAAGSYDHLIIDAYSSDSVPVHMMTTEATAMFMNKVKQGGMLVMHLSNRHLDLSGVAAANAKALGYAIRVGTFIPKVDDRAGNMVAGSQVAVMVREEKEFGELLKDPRWKEVANDGIKPWTDAYSNILTAMLRRYFPDSTDH